MSSPSPNTRLGRKMRPASRLTIAAVIAVCGVALLSQLAMPSPGPIETEDIFASLEKPVAPRSRLPRARDFTTRSFTRPGMGSDSLVQKRHRLEAEKKLLEVRRSLFLPKPPLAAPPCPSRASTLPAPRSMTNSTSWRRRRRSRVSSTSSRGSATGPWSGRGGARSRCPSETREICSILQTSESHARTVEPGCSL